MLGWFVIFLIFCVIFTFLGTAAGGAYLGLILINKLWRYRFRWEGIKDQRNLLFRFWRKMKMAMFQPLFSMTLALLLVALLSLFFLPFKSQHQLISEEDEASLAQRINAVELAIFEFTEKIDNGILLPAFLILTAVLLCLNLIWPSLPLLRQSPRIRSFVGNAMIFLTVFSAFTLVSAATVGENRLFVTSSLRDEIRSENEKITQLGAEAASMRLMEESIQDLDSEQARKLVTVLKACRTLTNASQVARSFGKSAGNELVKKVEVDASGALRPADELEKIDDWARLEQMREKAKSGSRRAALVKQAAYDSFLTTLDELLVDLTPDFKANALAKTIFDSFVGGATDSLADLCLETAKANQLDNEIAIRKHLDGELPGKKPSHFMEDWLVRIPSVDNADEFSAFLAATKSLDGRITKTNLQAARAAKAAAKADDAAKAAKSAGKILRLIF